MTWQQYWDWALKDLEIRLILLGVILVAAFVLWLSLDD